MLALGLICLSDFNANGAELSTASKLKLKSKDGLDLDDISLL